MIDLSAQILDATSEADRQKWRQECRRSLYFLCKAVLGFKDFTPDLHREACAFVETQSGRRRKFMLPRFFFKSHIGTIGYPLWLVIQEPDPPHLRVKGGFYGAEERILILNAAEQNSKHFLGKIKSIIEGNAVFQWLFPELIPDFTSKDLTWNELESSIVRPNDYPEPTFTAAGASAHITSRHFTRIICDDLIDEHHADSPDLMNKAIENFGRYEPLLVTLDHEITVIGTRWAFNDLYSWLDKNDGIYDELERPKGWLTYLRSAIENGKPIFPQRLPLHEFERLKKTRGAYYVSCLFQNEPRSPDVNVFQEDWLNWFTFDSRNHLVTEDGKTHNPAAMQRVVVIDIATGKTSRAAYSAVIAAAMDDLRRIYILEAWHGRVRNKELVNRAIRFALKWHADIKYESYGQQKLLEDPLKDAAALTGQYINIEPISAGVKTAAVDTQIEIFGRLCENGQVYCRHALTEFLTEFRDYPLGEYKDMLAAVSYTPKVFSFTYMDIADLTTAKQKRSIDVTLIHARPGLLDLDKVARDSGEGAFERMLTLGGRSSVSGY
jgi:hypothetical protein